MSNVRELKVVATDEEPHERVKKFDEVVPEARAWLREHKKCGFLIVGYAKTEGSNVFEFGNYSLDHAMDSYYLQEMAKQVVIRIRENDK